jgi:hypothetical protein
VTRPRLERGGWGFKSPRPIPPGGACRSLAVAITAKAQTSHDGALRSDRWTKNQKFWGDIEGLWLELNVLRIVVANLIAREAIRTNDPDGALRKIADDLHASWDDSSASEEQRRKIEPARMAIDDIKRMGIPAKAMTDERKV